MGESVVENSDPRLGSTRWADWTNQASNRPLIVAQIRELVPVQEMLPFQRQIFQENAEATPAQGQQSIFSWVVPQNEAWRILNVSVIQSDTSFLIFTFNVISARDVNVILAVSELQVFENILTALYPSSSKDTNPVRFSAGAGPEVEAYPGDTVQVRQTSIISSAGGAQVNAIMRWELIPLPLTDNLVAIANVQVT